MKTTNVGSIINFAKAMDNSQFYADFIAIQDDDGAIIHIRKSEVMKMANFIQNQGTQQQTQTKLDDYFTKG